MIKGYLIYHPRKIKNISGNPSSWVGSLVTHHLSYRFNPNLIRIDGAQRRGGRAGGVLWPVALERTLTSNHHKLDPRHKNAYALVLRNKNLEQHYESQTFP